MNAITYLGISEKECDRLCDALEFGSSFEDYYDYQKLVEFIARQPNESIKESLLNALYKGIVKNGVLNLDLNCLINQIPKLSLDCLLYLIDIIGLTGSEEHLKFLNGFNHPAKEVQESIQYAITEIKYYLKKL